MPKLPAGNSRGRRQNLEALFPGYLFARLDPEIGDVRLTRYARGVLYILGHGSEPAHIPDDILAAIRKRVERACATGYSTDLLKGEEVVITSGPLRDVEAIFDRRLSGAGRVLLLVRLLGRLCYVHADQRNIRRAKQATMNIQRFEQRR